MLFLHITSSGKCNKITFIAKSCRKEKNKQKCFLFFFSVSVSCVCRHTHMEMWRWWRCDRCTWGRHHPGAQSDHWLYWELDSCCCCCRPAWAKTQTVTTLLCLDWVVSSFTLMIQRCLQPAQLGFQYQNAATQLSWQAALPPGRLSFSGSWVTTRVFWFIIYVRHRSLAALSQTSTWCSVVLCKDRCITVWVRFFQLFLFQQWRPWYFVF